MPESGDPDGSGVTRLSSTGADRRLELDRRVAALVHRSMIPANQRIGNIEVVCDFRPSSGIGGDYASVHFSDERHLVVSICDVSGHGVAAALLATRVNSFVLNRVPHVEHPGQLVAALNEFVFRTFYHTGLYVTFFCLFIDLDEQTVCGAGCGHPPVLQLINQPKSIRRLDSANLPIGLFADLSPTFSMLKTPFLPGDRLVLYTDGITESVGPDGAELGVNGLERYVEESAHRPLKGFTEAIRRRVVQFREGVPADDDELLLAIAYIEGDGGSSPAAEASPA